MDPYHLRYSKTSSEIPGYPHLRPSIESLIAPNTYGYLVNMKVILILSVLASTLIDTLAAVMGNAGDTNDGCFADCEVIKGGNIKQSSPTCPGLNGDYCNMNCGWYVLIFKSLSDFNKSSADSI